MAETRFDFGTKYAILDYKIKEIRDNTAYDASFDVDEETLVVTLTLFNEKHESIKTASFELPLSSLITSVELDYNNKKLIFNTISSEPIECDISELINKIIDIETNAIIDMIPITWESLKSLRDNSLLKPSQQYRITDYITTTTQADTQSAGHQFDIIVTADSVNKLNEQARAVHSDRSDPVLKGITASVATLLGEVGDVLKRVPSADDNGWPPADFIYAWGTDADISNGDIINFVYTRDAIPAEGDDVWCDMTYGVVVSRVERSYFANSKLESWKLKYCLDNDTARFAWAKEDILTAYGDDYIYIGKRLVTLTGNQNLVEVFFWSIPGTTSMGLGTLTKEIEVGVTVVHSLYSDDGGVNWYEDDASSTPTNYQAPGKGVIYRMIDEFNNDVPYDFKNIQFKRSSFVDIDNNITFTDKYFYTFSAYDFSTATGLQTDIEEASLLTKQVGIDDFFNYCYGNSIKPRFNNTDCNGSIEVPTWYLNDIVFINRYAVGDTYFSCYSNTFGYGCTSNTFGTDCTSNTFGNMLFSNTFGDSCSHNTFGNNCRYNTFGIGCTSNIFGSNCFYITFGTNCYSNTFGNDCTSNTFGNMLFSNTFGDSCYSNTFGNNCDSNTFGNNCYNNTFGYYCNSNTFGNYCYSNIFGNGYQNNTFGDKCYSNTFGNSCNHNTFGNSCTSNTFGNYCNYNTFVNYCNYNTFVNNCYYNTFGNDCSYLKISENAVAKKYLNIDNGLQGASSANKLELYDSAIANKSYQITFKKDADGKFLMLWADDIGDTNGKYKNNNLDPTWKTIEQLVDGGTW